MHSSCVHACLYVRVWQLASPARIELIRLFMREDVNEDLVLFLILTDYNGVEINYMGPRFNSCGLMTPEQLKG